MKVTIYPSGPDILRRQKVLREEGLTDEAIKAQTLSVEIDWPHDIRLPVRGDILAWGWMRGEVLGVVIACDTETNTWSATVALTMDWSTR